tara:strand:+ start:69 stop:668 length:600 start_codon:yes stop_codon:yes gene_type:complete
MATLFDEILTKGVRAGQVPARTQKARNWYRETASEYKNVRESQLFGKSSDKQRMMSQPLVGGMYMMEYVAKHKSTLPYYDRLPLIFPYKKVKGGFFGLNMHYLPLDVRASLMDALYDTANNTKYDESTRLRISYQILDKASKYRDFKPCVKRYLTSQISSKFLYIYPSEWDIALFLPTERFVGASKSSVFADSRKAIRG